MTITRFVPTVKHSPIHINNVHNSTLIPYGYDKTRRIYKFIAISIVSHRSLTTAIHLSLVTEQRIFGGKNIGTIIEHNLSIENLSNLVLASIPECSEDIIENPIDWEKTSSNLLLKLKQSKEFLNQIM